MFGTKFVPGLGAMIPSRSVVNYECVRYLRLSKLKIRVDMLV
jgi:hypothetical protein